jgi:hypothetical protein
MPSFTLDTNCIIALERNELSTPAIRTLVDAHERGLASVAVVAISASERQKGGEQLRSFDEFRQRLCALGLGALEILRPIFYWDLAFWDWAVWAPEPEGGMLTLEQKIHEALFPTTSFLWSDFCAANGLDPASALPNSKWRNHKCDVLAIWSHISNARDVFVTHDSDFHKGGAALVSLGAGRIEIAETAVTLL